MQPFQYSVPDGVEHAIDWCVADSQARFIAGGTGLVDLMKLEVETPGRLIDLNRLPLADVSETDSHGVRIGAMARNSTVAYHPLIRERYPVLADALLAGASAQLRNMATVGGNLMQRTRCTYFRDVRYECNKRTTGSGCAAADGFHRSHAIFGTSEACFATHPSDMSVALICLDAVVETRGPGGDRRIPIADFHTLPGSTPNVETVLGNGELIVAVDIPRPAQKWQSGYVKIRDRASYEFALVSVAALVAVSNGTISDIRIGLGGVATKPWRAFPAETALRGVAPSVDAFRKAAALLVSDASPRRHNRFKVELLKRTLVRTLSSLTGVTE